MIMFSVTGVVASLLIALVGQPVSPGSAVPGEVPTWPSPWFPGQPSPQPTDDGRQTPPSPTGTPMPSPTTGPPLIPLPGPTSGPPPEPPPVAPPPGHPPGTVDPFVTVDDPEAVEEYWTTELVEEAAPLPFPLTHVSFDIFRRTAKYLPAAGPVLTPGGDALGYAKVSPPYTTNPVTRATSKIVFLDTRGRSSACSGSILDSPSGSIVVTAAQCVYTSPGAGPVGWHQKIMVIPAYHTAPETPAPYGEWAAEGVWVPPEYLETGDKSYDLAFLRVTRNEHAKTLHEVVGTALAPLLSESGGFPNVTTYGYPADSPPEYTGEDLFSCVANTKSVATGLRKNTLVSPNCAVRGGHSGGPVMSSDKKLVGVVTMRLGSYDGTPDVKGGMGVTRLDPEVYTPTLNLAERYQAAKTARLKLTVKKKRRPAGKVRFTTRILNTGVAAAKRIEISVRIPRKARYARHGKGCKRVGRRTLTCRRFDLGKSQSRKVGFSVAATKGFRVTVCLKASQLANKPICRTVSARPRPHHGR